jgi:hypothetical protein
MGRPVAFAKPNQCLWRAGRLITAHDHRRDSYVSATRGSRWKFVRAGGQSRRSGSVTLAHRTANDKMKKPDIQRTYYRNGRLDQEVPFVGGVINGIIREWHKSGALAREVPMKDGHRHGVCKQWDKKGALLGTFEMRMGTGISKQWYPNGQTQFEASVVNEKFNGRLRQWSDRGQLIEEAFFLDNKKVSKLEYDRAQQSNPDLPAYPDADAKHPIVAKRNNRRA